MKKKKERIDELLIKKGFFSSLDEARKRILSGKVRIGTVVIDKVGMLVEQDSSVFLKESPRYVSRGGMKLEGALNNFQITAKNKICLDIGSSTGGFTDCLLQFGASFVYAVDVGTNQLDYRLRSDERVSVRENVNALSLRKGDFPSDFDLCVVDVSFISLVQILPPLFPLMKKGGEMICLIKPQFELPRGKVPMGGVVRKKEDFTEAIEKISDFISKQEGIKWLAKVQSCLLGRKGNTEFLCWLKRI